VALSQVPVGGSTSVRGPDGKPVIVSRPDASSVKAFSAICTHMGCTVASGGPKLRCPCHGSVYDAATGAVLQGPAPRPLPELAVHVAGGSVVTGPA
jgi:cytochrome b6-f complex iron-sulfur subunit